MLFLGGVQLVCLGIIGEYLGRVFNELKPRPIYVIEELIESPNAASSAGHGRATVQSPRR